MTSLRNKDVLPFTREEEKRGKNGSSWEETAGEDGRDGGSIKDDSDPA